MSFRTIPNIEFIVNVTNLTNKEIADLLNLEKVDKTPYTNCAYYSSRRGGLMLTDRSLLKGFSLPIIEPSDYIKYIALLKLTGSNTVAFKQTMQGVTNVKFHT